MHGALQRLTNTRLGMDETEFLVSLCFTLSFILLHVYVQVCSSKKEECVSRHKKWVDARLSQGHKHTENVHNESLPTQK